MPFSNATFDFRCPAQCASVVLQNPRTVGVEQVDFVPLIVGGGDSDGTYRGDSFVCAAALQAYVQSNLALPRFVLSISTSPAVS